MARFVVGETLQTVGRTIESGDVGLFAGLSGDFNPAHTNVVYAADGQFGVRIAHGLLTLAVSSGQMNQTPIERLTNPHNAASMCAKAERMGHILHPPTDLALPSPDPGVSFDV